MSFLIERVHETKFIPGDSIIVEEEFGIGLYFLVSGKVKITQENDKVLVAQVKAPDYFGELSLLSQLRCTCQVKALSEVVTLFLKRDDFKTWV